MSYDTASRRPGDEAFEAKVPATVDTKTLLTKLSDAFRKLRKSDGHRDR
jgi:hypothetical protein